MLIALNENGNRVRASPKTNAVCPICMKSVIPKCGHLNIWHFAHHSNSVCNYGEGVGEWHLKLQEYALNHGYDVEVPIKNSYGKTRIADIVAGKHIIELQHSTISVDEIIKRSYFYVAEKFLVDWVIDYSQNSFLTISSTRITANGYHKKVFDCLFNKHFGYILFDIGNGLFFKVNKFSIDTQWEHNDFGSKKVKTYCYDGFVCDSFLSPDPFKKQIALMGF